jgi:hypothetical protein
MVKFKSKQEAQEAFEKEGIEFPTYKSGGNEGKIKGSLDSLSSRFSRLSTDKVITEVVEEKVAEVVTIDDDGDSHTVELVEEDEVVVEDTIEVAEETKEVVSSKPIFHRLRPRTANPMKFVN